MQRPEGREWPGQSVGGRARPGPGCQRALGAQWLAQVKPWPWPSWEVFDNSFQPPRPFRAAFERGLWTSWGKL